MTQYHKIDFKTDADSSFLRIELPEGETPTSGAPFDILVFSPSSYDLFLSCEGNTQHKASRYPVIGSGRASYVFSDSESVSGPPDEITDGEWIGKDPGGPSFMDESLDLPAETEAALYDYETRSYADLVEINITEDVSSFLIAGKNAEGETASLSIDYSESVDPDIDWGICSAWALELEEPETITPGDLITFKTAGPVPTAILPTGGGTVTKLTTIIEEHTERLEFVDGWATASTPIWDNRKDKRYPVKSIISGGVLVEVAGSGGEMPTPSWNKLFADLGTTTPPATWEGYSKKVFVQAFEDLGEDYGRGIIADINYKTEWTKWETVVPNTWYATGFPVAFQFDQCDDKEHVFTVDVIEAGPAEDIQITWTDRNPPNEVVPDAAISLGLNGGALVYQGQTDANGQIVLLAIIPGTHKIVAVKSGWIRTDEDSMEQNDWITVE